MFNKESWSSYVSHSQQCAPSEVHLMHSALRCILHLERLHAEHSIGVQTYHVNGSYQIWVWRSNIYARISFYWRPVLYLANFYWYSSLICWAPQIENIDRFQKESMRMLMSKVDVERSWRGKQKQMLRANGFALLLWYRYSGIYVSGSKLNANLLLSSCIKKGVRLLFCLPSIYFVICSIIHVMLYFLVFKFFFQCSL